MPGDLSITIRFCWRRQDADGSRCELCGDLAWREHYRLFIELIGHDVPKAQDVVLCGACFDDFRWRIPGTL